VQPLLQWKSKKYYIFGMCVIVASVIEHAKRIGRIIFSSIPCSALQYFSALFRKRNDFRGKIVEYKKAFCFSVQNLSEILLVIRIIE
jgi:hypothetical protein